MKEQRQLADLWTIKNKFLEAKQRKMRHILLTVTPLSQCLVKLSFYSKELSNNNNNNLPDFILCVFSSFNIFHMVSCYLTMVTSFFFLFIDFFTLFSNLFYHQTLCFFTFFLTIVLHYYFILYFNLTHVK